MRFIQAPVHKWSFQIIYRADNLAHRLNLHWKWLCELLDISCGMRFEDRFLNGKQLRRTWLNRLAMRILQ